MEKEEFEIDEHTKASMSTEWIESPTSVDLRSCKRGDLLLTRNGLTLYYREPLPKEYYFDHEVSFDKEGKRPASRTHAGKTLKTAESDTDIIEIIRK